MQHLYESYFKIVQRILEGSSAVAATSITPLDPRDNLMGVQLPWSSIKKFERLSDRIQLFVLSEIVEFITEKDALISTVSIDLLCP